MLSELHITIKGEDSVLKKSYLLYEDYSIAEDDTTLNECIQDAIEDFQEEVENIFLNIKISWY